MFCLSWAKQQPAQILLANRLSLPTSQISLCCWICCACLVWCNQCISTCTMHETGKHTKYNWLVWVNLLGWLVWMLCNATCTAVIDNINERTNIACNTQCMCVRARARTRVRVCVILTGMYSCYNHYGNYHSGFSGYTIVVLTLQPIFKLPPLWNVKYLE